MKNLLAAFCAGITLCFLASCNEPQGEVKSYNQGINVIPAPQSLVQHDGFFQLNKGTSFAVTGSEAKTVAEFFAAKIKSATGFETPVGEKGNISLAIDPEADIENDEGYLLEVSENGVSVVAKQDR